MFKMAGAELFGRRAVIVEADADVAVELADDLRHAGGTLVGSFASVKDALGFLGSNPPPDCMILDIGHADTQGLPVVDIFARHGVAVVFVTGYDAWFLDQEDEEDQPIHHHAGFARC